ncbi:MAG: hypothetical protein R3C51_01310 [Parvularculaceae bacterium]
MTEKTRFIVLTNGRSGSNFLVNALNQHPELVNYGEVLGEWTTPWRRRRWLGVASDDDPASIARYLDRFFTSRVRFYAAQAISATDRRGRDEPVRFKRWRDVKAIGVKEFQLLFDQRNLGDYLARRADIKVIGLTRSDPVRRYLSRSLLQRTGQAAARSTEKAVVAKIRLDAEQFIKGVGVVAEENRRLSEALAAIDDGRKIVVEYDEYFAAPSAMAACNDAMFRLLGLAPVPTAGEHRKLNTRGLRDTIENYDEILVRARGTEIAPYMEE